MLKRMRDEADATTTERPPRALYSYWRSSASWRVRIALELKQLPYEYRPVNLLKKEEQAEWYTALNPNGIPTYVEEGGGLTVIPQSMAILEYLDEKYPNTTPLLPKDPVDRAKVRATALIVVSYIHPLQNNTVLGKMEGMAGADAKTAWAKEVIAEGLASLEQQIRSSAGKYSYGDNVTMIDVCLVPQVYNARRFGVALEPFPTIVRVCAELDKLDAFSASHPDKMPDASA
jgi:maleylacetoacetate isomerase